MRCQDRCLRSTGPLCRTADNKASFRRVAQQQTCSVIRRLRSSPKRNNTCFPRHGRALPFHETCSSGQRTLTARNPRARRCDSEGETQLAHRVAPPSVPSLGSARPRDKSQFQISPDPRGKAAGPNHGRRWLLPKDRFAPCPGIRQPFPSDRRQGSRDYSCIDDAFCA